MRNFLIQIGQRGKAPRLVFKEEAADWAAAFEAHAGEAQPGERVEICRLPTEEELLAADVQRNENKAQRRHAADDRRALEEQQQRLSIVGGL